MSSIAPSSQPKPPALISPWLTGPWGMVGLLSILYTLVFIVWTQFHWGGEENISLIGNLAILPPMLFAALMTWRVAAQRQLPARLQRAWLLLGLGIFSFWLGEATWMYLENVLHVEPFPSIADTFFLASYPLMLWGLMIWPGAHRNAHQRIMFWFDLLIMLTSAFMYVSYFLIIPAAQGNNSGLLASILASAYPIGDLILISGVLSLLLRLPDDETRAVLRLLLIGLTFFIASDVAFGYASLAGTYAPGNWIDAGWHVFQVFMMLAALRQLYGGPVPPTKSWWIVLLQGVVKLLPRLTILLGYGLTAYIAITNFNETVGWIFIAAAFLTVLIIARQVFIAGFSATSIRTKLILTFLLVCVSSLELVSIFTYFALRSHPASAWQVIGVTTTVVILLTIGAAIFLAQRFVAPISRLTSVAHQIAAGDLTAKAQVESGDEIGTLASTFNNMLETLSRTQKELQESESLYRSLVDHSPDVITVHSRGKILFTNPAGVKVLGAQNAEDLVGQHILELIPAQDRERVMQGIEQLQTSKESTPLIQQTMHRLDGTAFEAEFRAIPIVYAGEPAIQFVMRDVTERRRLEEQWQKFKQGIECSREAVFMTEVDGTIIYINPAFETMYGYTWDEAVGKTPRILKSGMLPPEVYQHSWETLLAKETVTGEIVNRTKEGQLINVEGSNNPIFDQSGSLIGFLGVHRDVTERKRAEEQIHQNAARAEAFARVASILNSRLELSAVAQAICEETARALAVPVVTVRLVNEHYDELLLVGQIGRKLEHVPALVPLTRPDYEAIAQQSSSMIMQPEWNQAENDRNAKLYAELDLRIGVHASIVHNGCLVGMLSLKTIGETREFTGDELDLIKGLADQAGLAISKAQLFAEVERRKNELEIRVEQRTAELNMLNQRLQNELAERQKLVQSLQESEQRFHLVFETSPDAILLIDPHDRDGIWKITDCNPTACKMNGFSRAELIGQSIDIFNLKQSTADEFAASLQRLRQEGVLHGIEATHRHKDGHFFPIEYSTSLITIGDRELLLSIDRDITERKQAQEDLKHAKEAAEESQRMAEAASSAKSEFLSRMSHELRTPMNAILGFAQLLDMSHKEPLSSTQKERVKQIVKGGQHLLDLINEILDISRIEANRLQISPEPVSVRESIQEVLDLTAPLAVKRHIQIVTKLGHMEINPFVMADRQRLKQVLLNLVGNAVKYNYDGGSVIINCQATPTKHWRISIADTGPGIPEDQRDRLFLPFERLVSEQSNVEGTGLGLTLAKRLVELMHGQIGVDSAPGRGSTFWIELPTAERPLERFQRTGSTGGLHGVSAATQTILYVEDNVANFELIQQVFADYSQLKLVWAADAKSGLEAAREHHPNLILLDLHLGGRDGAELLQQLKQLETTAAIPVVVVSADATSGQARRLTSLGAHSYLTKPLDVKHFVQIVEELLTNNEINHAG